MEEREGQIQDEKQLSPPPTSHPRHQQFLHKGHEDMLLGEPALSKGWGGEQWLSWWSIAVPALHGEVLPFFHRGEGK